MQDFKKGANMTTLIILEIIKAIAWAVILFLAIKHRKHISVNIFWLTLISSILMLIAGIEDIINHQTLIYKSFWWFVANVFIIANYFVILRRSWRFYGNTSQKITDFVEQVERDRRKLYENISN